MDRPPLPGVVSFMFIHPRKEKGSLQAAFTAVFVGFNAVCLRNAEERGCRELTVLELIVV